MQVICENYKKCTLLNRPCFHLELHEETSLCTIKCVYIKGYTKCNCLRKQKLIEINERNLY